MLPPSFRDVFSFGPKYVPLLVHDVKKSHFLAKTIKKLQKGDKSEPNVETSLGVQRVQNLLDFVPFLLYTMPQEVRMGRLKGKVAIITGASRGIGEAVARRYAREGAKVVLVSRSPEALRKVTQAIKKEKGEALAVVADVSSEADVFQLTQATTTAFKTVDILVTSAGILTPRSPLLEVTEKEWDATMAVNLKGSFLCAREALKVMTEKKSGSVIFISSGAGKRAAPYWGPYAVSKFGVEGLMLAMAEEVRERGVRVNAVNPGGTRTGMRAMAYPDEDPKALPAPDDIAGLFVYLGSDASKEVIGQSIELREWLKKNPEWK